METTLKEDALLAGEWTLIIIGMLFAAWVVFRFIAQEGGLKEILNKLLPKNPVPLLAALGLGAIILVGVLLLKGVVMYLNRGNAPPENPAAAILHLPARKP